MQRNKSKRNFKSTKSTLGIGATFISSAIILASCCTPPEDFSGCVEFESLAPNFKYRFQDNFVDSGALMTVEAFQWGNGNWTTDNFVMAVASGNASFGNVMVINNMNLRIDMGAAATSGLTFAFSETGGNINMTVNGEFRNFGNFVDIDGQIIGNTTVAVQNGLGNDAGTVTIKGAVVSFSIGGQELWVDRVCAH